MAPGILTGPSIAGGKHCVLSGTGMFIEVYLAAILGAEHQNYLGLQIFVGVMLIAGSAFFLTARLMGLQRPGKF